MAGLQLWVDRFWQDLQPTPGRLGITLRIVLATILAVVLVMTLHVPAGAFALYFIFLLARESPAISLRSGLVALLSASMAVAVQLAVVIVTDNNPAARVISVSLISFVAGIIISSTTIPSIGVILGFVFCTAIGSWESHRPAEVLVKGSLWLIASCALGIACAVLVEYALGSTNPVERLKQQLQMRHNALAKLFRLIASDAAARDILEATVQVGRLATTGQRGMQELYNTITERKLDADDLPPGTRVHITMLAQLMDLSVAFGSQAAAVTDAQIRERCGLIADQVNDLGRPGTPPPSQEMNARTDGHLTLLDRIEMVLHNIRSMPQDVEQTDGRDSGPGAPRSVPLLVPNALRNPDTVAFALKLSLCATICYVFDHAVDWAGISTCVTTVIITALSTRGAINQKLAQRVLGSIIGGLILAIGATAFLFPRMESITSLVVLVAAVCFVSAWCAIGRRFSYVGLQIALAFYLVAFEGFGPSIDLAPARDRFAGIVVGLIVMWVVFGEIWPVRTLTVMRRKLASVVGNTAILLSVGESQQSEAGDLRNAEALRDQVGRTVAELRTLNDAAEYEFGSDRQEQIEAAHVILRAALHRPRCSGMNLRFYTASAMRSFVTSPVSAKCGAY
jgi:multidrug resistance protein MdtO